MSNILATWCKELTPWKRPWCWARLRAGGEGDRGWDGWMASPTRWPWVWASSGSWWWTGRPGMLQPVGSQTVGQEWATELNWGMTPTATMWRMFWKKYQIGCWDICHWRVIQSRNKRCRRGVVLYLVTQLCLIRCDPMDCSPASFSVHGGSPGKNTEVGCHILLHGIFPI